MQDIPRFEIRELAHKIKEYETPTYAFFLGAGASKQSGIPAASDMIYRFKEKIIERSCPDGLKTDTEKTKWLTEQDWYKSDGSEYCKFFERFEPKEYRRQRYIEKIIEKREPSFGYVVLANLMAVGLINTIITTNFDDLIYSACTTFTGIRPTVYAYGLLAAEMRFTSQRPKILKLHGDYLYSRLKNTSEETAVQDPNMERQVKQALNEYGLIVVGYSGGDESVMKVLSNISPENDLYWCIRRGEKINASVEKLMRDKRGFLIEIEGFDEMMNEIRRVVGFDVKTMLGSIEKQRNQIINHFKTFEPQFSAEIIDEILQTTKEADTDGEENRQINALAFALKAYNAVMTDDFAKAEELSRKAIEIDPNYANVYIYLGIALNGLKRYEEAEAAYRKAIKLNPYNAPAYHNLGAVLRNLKRYDEAEAALRKAIMLNSNKPSFYTDLGILLGILKRNEEAEAAYRKAIELDPNYILAYSNLAVLLRSLKRYEEAEIASRKAVEIDRRSAHALNSLALSLRLSGRQTQALTFAERANHIAPNTPLYLASLAAIHKELGNQEESNKYADQCRKLFKPDDWYNRACLESVCGNADAAIENLRRAAQENKLNPDWARRDPDFEWIRDDPRFKEIVGE